MEWVKNVRENEEDFQRRRTTHFYHCPVGTLTRHPRTNLLGLKIDSFIFYYAHENTSHVSCHWSLDHSSQILVLSDTWHVTRFIIQYSGIRHWQTRHSSPFPHIDSFHFILIQLPTYLAYISWKRIKLLVVFVSSFICGQSCSWRVKLIEMSHTIIVES